MIGVVIHINGREIARVEARNISERLRPRGVHEYKVYDTGEIIRHRRENGAVKLAIKMLRAIREPGPIGPPAAIDALWKAVTGKKRRR